MKTKSILKRATASALAIGLAVCMLPPTALAGSDEVPDTSGLTAEEARATLIEWHRDGSFNAWSRLSLYVPGEHYVANELIVAVDLQELGLESLDAGSFSSVEWGVSALNEAKSVRFNSYSSEVLNVPDSARFVVTLPDGMSVAEAISQVSECNYVFIFEANYYYFPQSDPRVPGVEPVQPYDFPDVSAGAWYAPAVNWCSSYGVMNGSMNANGVYMMRPKATLTRAEALQAISNLTNHYGEAASTGAVPSFKDANENAWYWPVLQTAVSTGVITGYPDRTFKPYRAATRQEFALMVNRSLAARGYALAENPFGRPVDSFDDAAAISDYAYEAMSILVTNGVFQGSDNMLRPNAKMTRAEMATVLQRSNTIWVNQYGAGE